MYLDVEISYLHIVLSILFGVYNLTIGN